LPQSNDQNPESEPVLYQSAVEDSKPDATISGGLYRSTRNSESSTKEVIKLAKTVWCSGKEAGRNRAAKAT
jgi:hypothetical protein